jgi:hypothetical protein
MIPASINRRRFEMVKRSIRILLFISMLSLATAGAAYAQEDVPRDEVRRVGVIQTVDLPGKTFTLRTLTGGDVHVHVTGSTEFRSPEGAISGFDDLEQGMRAQVVGKERGAGTIQATLIVVARAEDLPPTVRVRGEISSVNPASGSFVLQAGDGRSITFKIIERTAFRSRDGSIQSLEDLEPGMKAMVVGVEQEGSWNALLVAAGYLDDLKERAFRVNGEITGVVPGQETFTLETRAGDVYTFQVSERTRFRSPDGTVTSIHDLKKGMYALVAALETEDQGNLALLVAAGYPTDRPARPAIDVHAAGAIRGLDGGAVMIETRDGRSVTFLVDGNTVFRSRDGSITSYDDLGIGMFCLVRATTLGDGSLLARWIGAGRPPAPPNAERSEPVRPTQTAE